MKHFLILFVLNFGYCYCFSQSFPFVSSNCSECELNNLYQHTKSIEFEGGNICCGRYFQLVFSDEFDGTTLDTSKWATWYYYGGGPPNHSNRTHANRGSYFKPE